MDGGMLLIEYFFVMVVRYKFGKLLFLIIYIFLDSFLGNLYR